MYNFRFFIIYIFLVSVSISNAAYTVLSGARQTVYQNGVPHTNKNGVIRTEYVPGTSFFPICLYHPRLYDDTSDTRPTKFDLFKLAGFNTIETTGGLSAELFVQLNDAGLQLCKTNARATDVCNYQSYYSQVLGWSILDEPEGDGNFSAYPARFEFFEDERTAIRLCDSVRPCFVNTTAWSTGSNRDWWIDWHQTSDISCHDNYPYDTWKATETNRPATLSYSNGIPETVSLAVLVNNQNKPVWLIVQTFEGSRWFWPTGDELRAMVYAGIVHGAAGITYFTYDNYVVRGNLLGISPDPAADYGTGRVATAEELNKIASLWNDTAKINQELIDLEPWLLSPTSSIDYDVLIEGSPVSSNPIRCVLKSYQGKLRLIVVNIDRVSLSVRFDFSNSGMNLCKANVLYRNQETIDFSSDILQDSFGPMEVKVYDLPCCDKADIDGNCNVNLEDLHLMIADWLN